MHSAHKTERAHRPDHGSLSHALKHTLLRHFSHKYEKKTTHRWSFFRRPTIYSDML